MDKSKLKDHKNTKGKLVTPLNSVGNLQNDSWVDNRLPEYIWIGMILDQYEREKGFQIIFEILSFLYTIAPQIKLPCLSEILSLDVSIQARFFEKVTELTDRSVLEPLTLVLTHGQYPVISHYFTSSSDIPSRKKKLINIIEKIFDHQSYESTDIRFSVVWYMSKVSQTLILPSSFNFDQIFRDYPKLSHDDNMISEYRPLIRGVSGIGMIDDIQGESSEYLQNHKEYTDFFWDKISKITDCKLRLLKYRQNDIDITLYVEYLYEIFNYLQQCYVRINPINNKMTIILGISIYAYKRLKEINDYRLGTSIIARGTLRVIIESYIMIKYLLQEESVHSNIWEEYQYYGLGKYKLVVAKWRESKKDDKNSVFDVEYAESLVNEFKMEEFIDIDLTYFDKTSIRDKAIKVQEKDLYDFYYDYFSSFEHSLWGSVRETSFMKCLNPTHKYHIVPDINAEITLKNIEYDCVIIMNKLIAILDNLYGLPENLYEKIKEYEQHINK